MRKEERSAPNAFGYQLGEGLASGFFAGFFAGRPAAVPTNNSTTQNVGSHNTAATRIPEHRSAQASAPVPAARVLVPGNTAPPVPENRAAQATVPAQEARALAPTNVAVPVAPRQPLILTEQTKQDRDQGLGVFFAIGVVSSYLLFQDTSFWLKLIVGLPMAVITSLWGYLIFESPTALRRASSPFLITILGYFLGKVLGISEIPCVLGALFFGLFLTPLFLTPKPQPENTQNPTLHPR